MNQADALDIVQSALWTIIVASGPAVGAAMAIGVIIALLQALTQVQEVTLTFIPKIIVILLVSSSRAVVVRTCSARIRFLSLCKGNSLPVKRLCGTHVA